MDDEIDDEGDDSPICEECLNVTDEYGRYRDLIGKVVCRNCHFKEMGG